MVFKRVDPHLRFWSKLRPAGECWEWTGGKRKGYGIFFPDGGDCVSAHRWAYQYMRSEIPQGLQLDHLCRNRACVNPWHLEPVTNAENHRRRTKKYLQAAAKER